METCTCIENDEVTGKKTHEKWRNWKIKRNNLDACKNKRWLCGWGIFLRATYTPTCGCFGDLGGRAGGEGCYITIIIHQ